MAAEDRRRLSRRRRRPASDLLVANRRAAGVPQKRDFGLILPDRIWLKSQDRIAVILMRQRRISPLLPHLRSRSCGFRFRITLRNSLIMKKFAHIFVALLLWLGSPTIIP